MDRKEAAIALALSLPVAAGVTVGVLRQTLGSWPVVSVAAGLGAGAVVFGLVALGIRDGTPTDGSDRLSALAERAVPESEDATQADLLLGAGMGALLTVFVWYIPLAPLLGGAAAGLLQGGSREDAQLAGFLSGVLVPLVALLVAVVAFLIAGAQLFGRFPFGPVVATLVSLAAIVYAVGLGTVGGWVGGQVLADERRWGRDV